MIKITQKAIDQLRHVMLEHPDDPIVRVTICDLSDTQLQYNITLEDATQEGDNVQDIQGVIFAVESQSVQRMDGVTVDFDPGKGFMFLHPDTDHNHEEEPFDFSSLNLN